MKTKLWGFLLLLSVLLLPGLLNSFPARAGDPDDIIGPADPNMLICAEEGTHLWVDLDSDAFNFDGTMDPDATVDPRELASDCQDAEDSLRDGGIDIKLTVEYARQTRIEGYVFEFHPDPNGPGGWTAVRSRDVPVIASGPGFEIMWGSEKDGLYFFNNLGEGPVTLNLRLPPDAHPINPDIIVMSRAYPDVWEVDLGFYRGDIPPDDVEALRLPLDHKRTTLIPGDTIIELDEDTGIYNYMPNVGGVLEQNQPIAITALAALVLILLPAAGILTFRRKSSTE